MDAGFTSANLSNFEADQMFEKTFGAAGIFDGQEYYNPWMKVDKRQDIGKAWIQKASIDAGLTGGTGTGGAGTAGSALIPVFVAPEIVDRTRALTPVRELIPRIAARGKLYDFNALTAKAGANWKLEDSSLNDDVDTYDRVSVAIKYGYAVGRVTGPAIAAMRGYQDALAVDVSVKLQSLVELEENTIINGDASTDAEEFTGLITGISTNTTDLSGAAVSLANIRSELATTFNAFGMVTLAVTDAATHNNIKGLLQDFQRVPAPAAEGLPFGIPGAFEFDGVNFIKSTHMPTTGSARRILFLDMRYLKMAVLQDITFEELAKNNDSSKFMLKVYECLVNEFEGAMSQIYGIA